MKPVQLRILGVLVLPLLFSACGKEPPRNEASASSISGFNYSGEGIQEYHVNGVWGGGISIGGGYGTVCCVNLPDRWTPDLKVTIGWRRSDCGQRGPANTRCPPLPPDFQMGQRPPEWKYKSLKKEVPVERFERGDTVQVFFLPDDQVKVYVSSIDPEHKDHPAALGRPHPLDKPNWKDSE
jgi:hypothetical protein